MTSLAQHGDIPWRQVRDLGNVLRHGYDAVDDGQVWVIVERDLPPLSSGDPVHARQSRLAHPLARTAVTTGQGGVDDDQPYVAVAGSTK